MEENRVELCLDDFRFVYFPCFKHFLKGLRDSRETENSWGCRTFFISLKSLPTHCAMRLSMLTGLASVARSL